MNDINCEVLELKNCRGLHARAAAKFVKTVEAFDATVTVSKETHTVSGESIMGLMMLSAGMGSQLQIRAQGPQSWEALKAIKDLIDRKFDEDV